MIIRPVLDLAGHQPVDSYEVPDRIRPAGDRARPPLRLPQLHPPAESCDLDHIEPHGEGGATCACNLVPLCRGHHRMKTAGKTSYRMLTPGTYHWTLPSGTYLVDPTGTHPLTESPSPDE